MDHCFPPWSLLFGLLGLAPKLIERARYLRMIVCAHSYPMHCTLWRQHFGRFIIGTIPCYGVVKWCTCDVIKWCTTHQIFAVCAWDWISDPPVLWIMILKSKMYIFQIRLCWNGISRTRRCCIQISSHASAPPFWLLHFCLNVTIHASLKVQPSRCCLMDVNNANTLSLMRHRIKPHKTHPWAMCSSAFFLRGLCQFTTSCLGRTNVCAKRRLLWYALLRHCICHFHCLYLLLNQYRCLQQCNIRTLDTFAWKISLNSEFASPGNPDLVQHYNCCFLSQGLRDWRLRRMYTKWFQIQ